MIYISETAVMNKHFSKLLKLLSAGCKIFYLPTCFNPFLFKWKISRDKAFLLDLSTRARANVESETLKADKMGQYICQMCANSLCQQSPVLVILTVILIIHS